MDPSSTLVHLDLAWGGGSTRGRVHIRLSPNTPAAQQFTLLSTGQTGVYRNTKLHHVVDEGEPWECVLGGDYEGKGGEGGAGIIDIRGGQYRWEDRLGAVRWLYDDAARAAQFAITTGDYEGVGLSNVFGEVVSGLEVVRAAANHSDITQVTVVDCGIVLNQ